MSECFPPIPLYIVTAIIAAMFTTVASKIEGDSKEPPHGDIAFASFLLVILAVPFGQLLLVLLTSVVSGKCAANPDLQMNADARWLLGFHTATLLPLLVGVWRWFWRYRAGGHAGRRLRLAAADDGILLITSAT